MWDQVQRVIREVRCVRSGPKSNNISALCGIRLIIFREFDG